MPLSSSRSAVVTWVVLMAATGASWALGGHHVTGVSDEVAACIVLAVALVKVRLVGQHFMELKGAPSPARRGLDAYCALALLSLMGVYLIA